VSTGPALVRLSKVPSDLLSPRARSPAAPRACSRRAPRSPRDKGQRHAEECGREVASRAADLVLRQGPEMQYLHTPRRESATRGRESTSADPVRRKRPGVRSSSTASLMASRSSGARCTSSMTMRCGRLRTTPCGSRAAALSTLASSSVRYVAPVSVYWWKFRHQVVDVPTARPTHPRPPRHGR